MGGSYLVGNQCLGQEVNSQSNSKFPVWEEGGCLKQTHPFWFVELVLLAAQGTGLSWVTLVPLVQQACGLHGNSIQPGQSVPG